MRNVFASLLLAASACSASKAEYDDNPNYTYLMPTPHDVEGRIDGSSARDTAIRRTCAGEFLKDSVTVFAVARFETGQLSNQEKLLRDRYDQFTNKSFFTLGRSMERWQVRNLCQKYEKEFADSLIPQTLRSRYDENKRIIAAEGRDKIVQSYKGAEESVASALKLFIVFLLAGVIALFLRYKSKKAKQQAIWKDRFRTWNDEELAKFGSSAKEREQQIDRTFDMKAATLTFRLDFREGKATVNCDISRALASMSPREREVLRSVYHLSNYNLNSSDRDSYIQRFALIYGDGKGQVTEGTYSQAQIISRDVNSFDDVFKAVLSRFFHTNLESAISLAISDLNSAIEKNPQYPLLTSLAARLFGRGGDMAPTDPLKPTPRSEPALHGLVLGLDERDSNIAWSYDGEGSLITVAAPGSGKTQCHVFPNLLQWRGPAVVLDVKGEIYAQTSKWRAENVGPVFKFSPLDPARSHCYNPLSSVRSDKDYLWEDSRFLADMMIVPTGAKDPFWESRARDVLTAAIAKVCIRDDHDRPMGDVMDVLHGVAWDKFVAYLQARTDLRSMSRAGHSLAEMEPKTRDGVLQQALSSMSAWDGDRIARATSKSDWTPLDLRGGTNPTIYICLKPNEVESYISVLRVFIAQHIRVLTSELPPRGTHSILFLLDELPRLRQMPPVEEALEIGRQYGIKLWMFTQSLGQLENAYPNAKGMVGSCAVRMFMNPSLHDETAQKLSDDIGFRESVVDGTRVKVVEPNVLAGPDFKDMVIVMAAHAPAARLRKNFAYADAALSARMGSL